MWAGPRPRKRSGASASSSARRGRNFLLDVEPPRKVRSSLPSSARPATERTGKEGLANKLVTGGPGNPHRGPFKDNEGHPIAYWAYATTVWDYINRAMPANKGGSLSPDEVYAVTAFLLYKNGIVQESDVMDAQSLPKIQMPNRNNFVPEVPVWPPNPKKPSWY